MSCQQHQLIAASLRHQYQSSMSLPPPPTFSLLLHLLSSLFIYPLLYPPSSLLSSFQYIQVALMRHLKSVPTVPHLFSLSPHPLSSMCPLLSIQTPQQQGTELYNETTLRVNNSKYVSLLLFSLFSISTPLIIYPATTPLCISSLYHQDWYYPARQ